MRQAMNHCTHIHSTGNAQKVKNMFTNLRLFNIISTFAFLKCKLINARYIGHGK